MQEFKFKQADDETYAVMGYAGDEKNVVIPDSYYGQPITIIFDGVFRFHTEIETVHIPETVTDIGEFVFEGCENLRQIVLPKGLTNLWGNTFARSGIEEITLPEGIMSIATGTFTDCKNLRKVVCSDRLWKIRAWAFGGCDNLTEVVHGPKTEISPDAFKQRPQMRYN